MIGEYDDAKKSESSAKEIQRRLIWQMQLKKIREEREKQNNRGIEKAPPKRTN